MAKVKRPEFVERLRKALVADLGKAGIKARVHAQPVPMTKLFRLLVLAPQFAQMRPLERQDLVWRIAGRALTTDQQMLISMIVTLSDDEASGREVRASLRGN